MSDEPDDYLSECHWRAMRNLRYMLDVGLDKKDEGKLVDIIETLIDVRLARLGLIPPQPPRRSLVK
jgi:hypothetical protein